ncbi:hypothetical protein N801_13855 [Knoellia aerolata DSM 18566]|uniref:Uncharacterized protein n=2 Tax=Knoellia TaxID=136099 RepID=A0A0A0K114_9MICO|nr:hypothetical protein N801_13855 [Knoellia aerolata DSM 18566]
MRWLGPPLLAATWLAGLSPVVLAIREGDWQAPVRDSGLGAAGASVGWVVVAVLLVTIPLAVRVLLTYRTVLDAGGVDAPFGRGRHVLADLERVRWVPQGGPVNAAHRPERFEVSASGAGLVARVTRQEADWESALAVLRYWSRARPEIVADEQTAQVLADAGP